MNMDKWTQQLHDKLAEREVAPPDNLWADIEAALPTTPEANQKPRATVVSLRRWLVAASLALLIAGGGYLYWQAPTTEVPTSSNPQPTLSQAEPKATTHEERSHESLEAQLTEPVPVSRLAQASVEDSVVETIGKTEDVELITESSDIPQAENDPQQSNHISQLPSLTSHLEDDETIREIDEEIALLSSKSNKDISINLYASNGFNNMQHSNGVRMDETLAARYNFEQYLPQNSASARRSEPIYLVGYEERQKHHQPISFGLSVSYPLMSHLSLSTGVTYTRLRSDFASIINGSSISQEQTLHYLGIPLNAQYRLFHHGGLNIYLSGGTEANYNIKARLTSEGVEQHIDRDRWQFSIQGGVGLQYDILPQLGLYAEPGVKHYFDNGSRLHNYFKDKPTSFNLQVGLRLNIIR